MTAIYERVAAYITHGDRLLVFDHTGFPEAGIQVPGGSVEPDEDLHEAVLRKAREETGLVDLQIRAYLGTREYDRARWGLVGTLRSHFYHLVAGGELPERWLHYEDTPSDGSPGPIEFEFYWVSLAAVPELACRQGDLLHRLQPGGHAMAEQQFPEPTVGALIFDPQGRLFLMRSHKWRGRYVVPGGHIELGERMEDALLREVKEETGLDVYDVEFLCYQEFIYDDAFWRRRHYIFFDFACRSDDTDVTLNHEAQSYVWVPVEEALAMPVEPYTRAAIQAYLERSS